MDRIDFSESITAFGYKTFASIVFSFTWLLNIDLHRILIDHGLVYQYMYFGVLGQLAYTLMTVREKILSKSVKVVEFWDWGQFVAMLIGWIVAPILSLVIVSVFSGTYDIKYGFAAFGVGAFVDYAWQFIKTQTKNKLDEKVTNKSA